MNQIVLALALLSFPSTEDTPEINDAEKLLIGVHSHLIKEFAITNELMDRREWGRTIPPLRPHEFAWDLNMLRRRNEEFADAPCIADRHRFPCEESVSEMLSFNRLFRKHLDNVQLANPNTYWHNRSIALANDQLFDTWNTLQDANREYYFVTVRRCALKKLRDEYLGVDAYYRGVMPSPVPLEYFTEIK